MPARPSTRPANREWVSCKIPCDYELRAPDAQPRELILLLHGFNETGKRIFGKLIDALPADAAVLAPNAIFPMPHRTEQGFRLGCTWYLYDPGSQEYYVDMEPALDYLERVVEQLGLKPLPKRVIGFSQGGYLAPMAAHRLGETIQVIGIGCEYLVDEFPEGIRFRIDGVHGAQDEVVTLEEARSSHERLAMRGIPGTFLSIPSAGHKIDDAIRGQVKGLISARPPHLP